MKHRRVAQVAIICVAAALGSPRLLAGQAPFIDRLSESRQLYESAEYDRALAVMDSMDPQTIAPALARDRALYQALCLLALDLNSQAEARIEAAVQLDPLFRPGPDLPPRVRAVIEDVRTRLRPDLAQQLYRAGKAMFDSKNYEGAIEKFTAVVKLTEEEGDTAGDSALSNVRALAEGFTDLSRRSLAAANHTRSASGVPVSTVVPPVVIYQALPAWPRGVVPQHGQLTGILELVVSARGEVGYVSLVRSIHPTYDAILTSAAKHWRYRPATRDGKPVAHVKRLAIKIDLE